MCNRCSAAVTSICYCAQMIVSSLPGLCADKPIRSTAHCTLHTTHCKLHTAHCTLHTAYCTLHTALCWFGNVHCLHTAHCTLHTAHKITAHFTQRITQGQIYTEEYSVNTTHCTWPLCTAQRTLHTNLWNLHTSYKLTNTAHCTLLTTHYTRQVCALLTDNKHLEIQHGLVLVLY